MKIVKYVVMSLGLLFFNACSNNAKVDDELSGNMLMGPYTVSIMSMIKVYQELDELKGATEEEKLIGYKNIFGHPYAPEISQQAKDILQKDFQIIDAASTKDGINKLLNDAKGSENKAFQYAMAVNAANFAYAAGYIPMVEVEKYEQKVLVEVRANYEDWDSYLKDFLKGRNNSNRPQNLEYQSLFENIVNEVLLKHEESPYKHYKL